MTIRDRVLDVVSRLLERRPTSDVIGIVAVVGMASVGWGFLSHSGELAGLRLLGALVVVSMLFAITVMSMIRSPTEMVANRDGKTPCQIDDQPDGAPAP